MGNTILLILKTQRKKDIKSLFKLNSDTKNWTKYKIIYTLEDEIRELQIDTETENHIEYTDESLYKIKNPNGSQ